MTKVPKPRRPKSPLVRISLLLLGMLLILLSPLVGVIPGPGGVFVFAGGLVLMLQNSRWVRWRFVLAKRRWPRMGDMIDRVLRRRSVLRRRKRTKVDAVDLGRRVE